MSAPSTDAERLVAAITAASSDTHPDDLLYDLFEGNHQAVAGSTVSTSRWEQRLSATYRLPDGTHATVERSVGATENQDVPHQATAVAVEPHQELVLRTHFRTLTPPDGPTYDPAQLLPHQDYRVADLVQADRDGAHSVIVAEVIHGRDGDDRDYVHIDLSGVTQMTIDQTRTAIITLQDAVARATEIQRALPTANGGAQP